MIISCHDVWADARIRHEAFLQTLIDDAIKKPSKIKISSKETRPFLAAVRQYLYGATVDLERSVVEYRTYLANCTTKNTRARFKSDLTKVFNYKAFTTKGNKSWDAYELCKLSRVKTCPYCNQAYAFTIVQDNPNQLKKGELKSFRPTLDHFWPKAEFPHLALALDNLVPSCYACNSSLKGQTDFYTNGHLHPLTDAESIEFKLTDGKGGVIGLAKNFSTANVKLELEFDNACTKTKNSIDTFLLKERYAMHLDDAREFAQARIDLNAGRARQIGGMGLAGTEESLLRFRRANYRNIILGKMFLDLFKQLDRN